MEQADAVEHGLQIRTVTLFMCTPCEPGPHAMLAEQLGFHHGRPVAALTIFRCCLQWKTFQAERTPLFDRIIAAMGSQVR